MKVTVTIPDEVAAEAQARGVALDTFVEKLLAKRTDAAETSATRREAVAAMRRFAAKHSARLGDADLRAMAHEGHKH